MTICKKFTEINHNTPVLEITYSNSVHSDSSTTILADVSKNYSMENFPPKLIMYTL